MAPLTKLPLFLVFILFSKTCVVAQSDELISGVQKILGLYQQGAYKEVLGLSQEVLMLAEKEFGTQDPLYAIVLATGAAAQAEMGEITEAESNYNYSLNILKKNPAPEFTVFIGNIYSGLARIESSKGRFDKAEKFLLKSAETFEKSVGKDLNYSNAINDLGNLYKEIGDYGKSERYLRDAADIRKTNVGETHELYGISLNNLGSLYEQLGDYERAADHYEEAISIWQKKLGNTHPLIANGANNLAGLFVKYQGYEKAVQYYQIALAICEKVYGQDHERYITTLSNIANAYRKMKDVVKAEEAAVKCLKIRKETLGENHIDYALSLNNVGLIKMDQGKFTEAEPMMLKSLDIMSKVFGPNHKSTSVCENNLGVLYANSGNIDKAATYLKKSLTTSLNRIEYVFPAINDKEKTFFYNSIQNDFEYFNYFAATNYPNNQSFAADIYNYTIATKALLLNTSNKIKKRILTSGDAGLIEMFHEWKNKKNRLAQVWQMSTTDKVRANINEAALEAEASEIEKKLSARSQIFKTTTENKKYTWKDIQRSLKPDEAAVEIVRFAKINFEFTDTIYYAAVIVKPGAPQPELVFFENGNFLETRALRLYKNAIQNRILDARSYQYLWAPIVAKLTGVKKVFVSPDGIYNQINLNSLYNEASKKYVIDEIQVQQVSNTKDVLALPARSTVRSAILLGFPDYATHPDNRIQQPIIDEPLEDISDSVKRTFGSKISPLPGTNAEVDLISQIFKSRNIETQIVTGVRANESFLKKIESPSVLHIATHGFFMADVQQAESGGRSGFLGFDAVKVDQNPLLRSGILLAGAEKTFAGEKPPSEDGVLSAYEAMTLNLDETELVVLSACETGLGEIRNGEGVYGFQRALIIAGAEAVVMSLWKVSDQVTQELMAAFYEFWTTDRSKREAFIMAQNKIRESHPEPYYWAPFIMIGD
ncbi:MAG TPA: CHAT domain-containing tetratricopeptide repeat protein [Chryseosolibacter sp.]|nr:CHAT domain-containing tetratricopeptide repeat protein [Chryseosolibacter sp.]